MRHIPILSVRQPWAWAIFNAGKDVENRDWSTPVRGLIGIHAGKGMTRREYEDFVGFYESRHRCCTHPDLGVCIGQPSTPPIDELERGVVLGVAHLVACSTNVESPWFQGEYGFVLLNPVLLPMPIPAKGRLGWWHAPSDVELALQELVDGRAI